MNERTGAPVLSVVVVSCNGPRTLRYCLEALRREAERVHLEVVIVSRLGPGAPVRLSLAEQFPEFRWTEVSPEATVPQMRGAGLRQTRAALVALLEDDCLVDPGWGDAIVRAHQEPYVAVGGAIEPSAYRSTLDWAVYFSEYVRFMRPFRAGTAPTLPGTNVSYKRPALAEVGGMADADGSPSGFYEVFVHQQLRRGGGALKLDPAPTVYNINSWRPGDVLQTRFHHGRGFAAMRSHRARAMKRAYFLALALALPGLQIVRVATQLLTRRRYLGKFALALPWLALLSVSWSAGEFLGYLLGPGDSLSRWR